MDDWNGTWGRELVERPPIEAFASGYFGYEPPTLYPAVTVEAVTEQLPEFED